MDDPPVDKLVEVERLPICNRTPIRKFPTWILQEKEKHYELILPGRTEPYTNKDNNNG